MNLKTEITKIHYNKDAKGLLVKLLDFASLFYGVGSGLKNFLYDKNILKPKKVDAFVISVGNLTTGGVGKTPVVAEIAKYLLNKGEKVAIVSRGYGGKLSNKNINVISDGEKIYYDAKMAGDEPFWLAENAARQLGSQAAKSGQAPSPDEERICGRTERSESGLRKDGAYCGEATNAELLEQRAKSRQGWDGVISTVNSENSQEQQTETSSFPSGESVRRMEGGFLEDSKFRGQEDKSINNSFDDIPQKSTCHCEESVSSTWQSSNFDIEKAGLRRFARNDSLSENLQSQKSDTDLSPYRPIALSPDKNLPSEIIFCGYGEPMLKFDVLKEVAKYIKENYPETKIRVNTNGHANFVEKRNVVPELKGLVDEFSVSLNGATKEEYDEYSRPKFDEAYDEMKKFIKPCSDEGISVVASVVDGYKGRHLDLEKCEKIASDLGAKFRVREWITNGY